MALRKAELNDIENLLRLQKHIIDHERSFDAAIRKDAIYYPEAKLKELVLSDEARVAVIEVDDQLMGCGFGTIVDSSGWDAYDKKGYIGMVYVDSSLRGQGFGKKILEDLINWFSKKEILDVQLNIYPDNTQARELYKKFGFSEHLLYMRKLN